MQPNKTAASMGKYYNGTPVRILEDLGEWAKVSIAGIEGYMMQRYLAFGTEMLTVHIAYAELFIKPELYGQTLAVYTLPDAQSEIAGVIPDQGAGREEITVIGLIGDDWLHVICGSGLAGYMPAGMFFPGNG